MDRKEQAIHLHKHGFNCAQSVVCSFCNVMGADPVEAFRMSEALGFGMGTMGTIIGRWLKGVGTGKPLRSCGGCITDAVELLDKHLLGL